MADPYAGIASPPKRAKADPYEGIASPPASGGDDPYADVASPPAAPSEGPGFLARQLNAFNRGATGLLALPGELIASAGDALGVHIPHPSQALDAIGNATGFANTGKQWEPQSPVERYTQSTANAAGQAALPVLGTLGAGVRLAAAGGSAATRGVLGSLAAEATANPGMLLAGEAGNAIGAGVGGQAARDAFPGNPYADMAGQIIGGGLGGFGAGVAVSRGKAAREALAKGAEMARDNTEGNTRQSAEQAAITPPPAGWSPEEWAQGWRHGPNGVEFAEAPLQPREVPAGSIDPVTGQLRVNITGGVRARDRIDVGGAAPGDVMPSTGGPVRTSPATGDVPPPVGSEALADPIVPRSPDWLDVGAQPPTARPPLYQPMVVAPSRLRDRIDVGAKPDPYAGVASAPMSSFSPGRNAPGRLLDRPTPEQMADVARSIQPGDVVPIPRNEVGSMDEAAAINAGMRPELQAPDERAALSPYSLNGRTRRNPMDLVSWLRSKGGVQDQGGELSALGINNQPRDLPFAKDESFLGRLVSPKGMTIDEAARAAHDAGYFPNHYDRPTPSEFLDALHETHSGGPARAFHPGDWEALDQYHAALTQRHTVEQAAQNGSPLHHDISQPAGLADLEANQPPTSAYEDVPSKRGGRVGNIALDKLETAEDVGRMLANVRSRFGGFDAARRGKITHAETSALARELGTTPDQIMKRQVGQAVNAEQATAMASILAKSSDEVVRLARAAQGGSDADKVTFWKAIVRHAAIQEQVEGAKAEAGRTLSAMRITAKAKDVVGAIHKDIIAKAGGPESVEDVARKIIDVAEKTGDPGKVAKIARAAATPGIGDKLSELYINMLLSGPQTHAANLISNLTTALLQLPEHVAAAAIGAARRRSSDRVLMGEVPARAYGMVRGAEEGMRAFRQTIKTGQIPDHAAKVEGAEREAISGVKGKVIRVPTKALAASDELFKGIARRMELNGLALRKAKAEGWKGPALNKRAAELADNPTEDMDAQARDYARYLTFQRPLGKVGQAVSSLSGAKVVGLPIGKLIVPFVRTPANLLKFAAERSPMAPLLKGWREDYMAGGARRDLAMAKAMLGSGMGLMFAEWARQGIVTGSGPADPRELQALKNTGWQPYSIRIGDGYISYARIDPLATTLGTAADLATKGDVMTEAQRRDAAGVIAAAIINNLASKTWLSGISDLTDVLNDPEQYGASYARNEVASLTVPALLGQIARANDPVVRQSNSVVDAVTARIPGLSRTLPARLNTWGSEVKRSHVGYGVDLVSPIAVSRDNRDPTLAEIARLNVNPAMPSKSIGGFRLEPRDYDAIVKRSGIPAKLMLDQIMGQPGWPALPDGIKQSVVGEVVGSSREAARNQMLLERPDLLQTYVQKKVQRGIFGVGIRPSQ